MDLRLRVLWHRGPQIAFLDSFNAGIRASNSANIVLVAFRYTGKVHSAVMWHNSGIYLPVTKNEEL